MTADNPNQPQWSPRWTAASVALLVVLAVCCVLQLVIW